MLYIVFCFKYLALQNIKKWLFYDIIPITNNWFKLLYLAIVRTNIKIIGKLFMLK